MTQNTQNVNFALKNIFLENASIAFIDKTNSVEPEKRENYWIHTLNTIVSWGLNVMQTRGYSEPS